TSWCKAPSRCFFSTISRAASSSRRSARRLWRGTPRGGGGRGAGPSAGGGGGGGGALRAPPAEAPRSAGGWGRAGAAAPAPAAGDVVLGIASSGVHSNGFSLVRKVVAQAEVEWDAPAPFDPAVSLGEAVLTPTRIYVKACLAAIRGTQAVKALAHITGGGFP